MKQFRRFFTGIATIAAIAVSSMAFAGCEYGDAYDKWWPVGAPVDMYPKVSWAVDRADEANDRGDRARTELILDRIERWKLGWGVGTNYPDSEMGKLMNAAGIQQLNRARTIRLELRAELEGDRPTARSQRVSRRFIESDIREMLAEADFEDLSDDQMTREEFDRTVDYWHRELDKDLGGRLIVKRSGG